MSAVCVVNYGTTHVLVHTIITRVHASVNQLEVSVATKGES